MRRWLNRFLFSDWLTAVYDQFQKHASLGVRGEIQAERFLLKQGWIILARSHATRLGEVDLIGVDGETLVFVEVKTRASVQKGLPVDAVDITKQRKIVALAEQYIRKHQLNETPIRFDIISIVWPPSSRPQLKHYVGAFEAA